MSIWVLQNAYSTPVRTDLQAICRDPGLTIDPVGRASYIQTVRGPGPDLVAHLVTSSVPIGIRGQEASWPIPQTGNSLQRNGGVAVPDALPSRQVDIVYDVTDCNGAGRWTYDPSGQPTRIRADVLLFHELAHARDFVDGSAIPGSLEAYAITQENIYRASTGLPARGSGGGCNPVFGAGVTTPQSHSPAQAALTAVYSLLLPYFGTDHVLDNVSFPASERMYRVYITNQTSATFSEIVVFYNRRGLSGVVYLSERDVVPGQVRSFGLGLAANMESYVVGFFIGSELVQQIPSSGNMTPALASTLNPGDREPALDAWTIFEG